MIKSAGYLNDLDKLHRIYIDASIKDTKDRFDNQYRVLHNI